MKIIYIILLFTYSCLSVRAQDFPYRYLTTISTSSSDHVYCMYIDKEGMMWLGCNSGLKAYNGYEMKTYKSSAYVQGILPNNNVRSITEDNNDCLWIGTRNGLVRMNKRTGEFKTFYLPNNNQRIIYTLFTSRDGTLWIGTDGGLSYYDTQKDAFYTYNTSNAWTVGQDGRRKRIGVYSVKAIAEDSNGDMLIGTWSSGLMRLKRGTNTFHAYPQLNALNSAYSLFFDKFHRLWVGTWGYGVVRIDNPNNLQDAQYHQYPYTTNHFDTFYNFVEDPISHTIWSCTREGVCFLDEQDPDAQWQCYKQIDSHSLNFTNDIATDGEGHILICTQNFGIINVNTSPSHFKKLDINTRSAGNTINFISAIKTFDGTHFWIGLNPYGIALYNRQTGYTLYNKEIKGFDTLEDNTLTTSISDIRKRSNGEVWFANNNYGIIVKPQDKPAYLLDNTRATYIKDNYINTLFESRDKTMWIGQRNGLSVVYPNNKGTALTMKDGNRDFSFCYVRHITQDHKGNIWISTDNEGIIRISGNPAKPTSLRYKQYSPASQNFAIYDAIACHEDRHGRLWAISNSGGLFLLNRDNDRFEPKNREYKIPGEDIFAINEDVFGNLWLTTDKALIQVKWEKNNLHGAPSNILCYTKEDGIGDILFTANATCRFGKELYFSNRTSILAFTPTTHKAENAKPKKLVITDLVIDDMPFSTLDSTFRREISDEMPGYTRNINIPSSVRKFSIEFSLLTYGNTQKNIYAYRLEGYDNDWRFCNGESHRATYQNLPSGTYQLHVRAIDDYGRWQEMPYTITVKILPPWYASRLAYTVYLLLFAGCLFGYTRWYNEHLRTKNRLQMDVILTNITHELLTPLTVIAATIFKLKKQAPQFEEDYKIMDGNINRTTRLLRQILEVRKSQAGQLCLLVSRNDIVKFVKDACENIRPMAEHKNITFNVNIEKNEYQAWFDADKLDKILYNLLSNAIKYNKDNGKIDLSMTCRNDYVTITVADNGIGISKEKQQYLYTRFFDGDYRKQKMSGTGIGLALTHDLVTLHHGKIHCKSNEGIGTTFTVILPVRKSAFAEQEIDPTARKTNNNLQTEQISHLYAETASAKKYDGQMPAAFIRKGMSKILIVEDNNELLYLMYGMLSKKYQVFTAKNGKQALTIISKEQLDLVISDVMMPVMDGLELTKRIKEDESYWQLPVILLTAKDKEEDRTKGYAIGADAFVTKPFKFKQLEVLVNTIISNRQKMKDTFTQKATAKETCPGEDNDIHFSDPSKAFVDKATKLVMEHLDDAEYDRDSFAKDMAMGASTLYNKIKSTTGQTVVNFMMTIRLNEAKRIMTRTPDILISDLASRVGFNTPKYFSKCFKKEFGLFPKEYAEQLKNQQKD